MKETTGSESQKIEEPGVSQKPHKKSKHSEKRILNPVNLQRIILITPIVIMTVIATIVTLNVMRELHFSAIEEKRKDLSILVRSWAEVITTMCEFETGESHHEGNLSCGTCMLKEVFSIQEGMKDEWKTGELIFARREGDQIVFLMNSDDLANPSKRKAIPLDSELAEPMRRAIKGESGTMIGLDYDGELVLSAFEPTKNCGLGLVGKIDMAEIEKPFNRASRLAGGLAILIISLGSIILLITINPIIKRIITSTADLKQEVSERKQTEKALRLSEEKYLDLYENAPDMYVSVDPKSALILDCNETLARKTGYSKEEIIGNPIFKMYHPDCIDDVKERIFKQFLETGEIIDEELALIRKDGSKIDVSLNISAFRDDEGNILYSRSSWRDISDRKSIENAMKSSLKIIKMMESSSIQEIMRRGLNECEKITQSKVGYFHFVNPDQSISNFQIGSDESMKDSKVGKVDSDYPVEIAGILMDCIHQRKPVIHNDYLNTPDGKDLPKNLSAIKRYLVVPVFEDDKIVATLGVGNRDNDYTQFDIDQVSLVLEHTWNVVQRKRTEEELARSEERFKAIVSSVPTPMLISRISDGKILFTNDHLIEMWGGQPKKGELQSTVDWYYNIEDRKEVFKILKKYGHVRNHELRVKRPDGTKAWVLISAEPMVYNDENSLIAALINITEQKHIKDLFRIQSEIVENMGEGVNLVKISDASIVYTNPRFEEMFGYDMGELIGKNVNILYAPSEKNPEEMKKEITSDLQTKGQWSGEIHTLKKDGTPFWSRLEITSFNHSEYGPIGLNVLEDITEEKLAKEKLIESNNLINSLLNSPKDLIIFALDREYRYTAFNESHKKTMFQYFGIEIEIGMNFIDLVPSQKTKKAAKKSIDRALNGEIVLEIEHQAEMGIVFELYWCPIMGADENVIGITAFIRDITNRKNIETALIEANEMARSAEKAANAGSWKWVLKTNEVTWSNNLCRINGIEPEQFDRTFDMAMSYIHKDDVDYVNLRCEEFLTTKKPNTFEYRIVTPNGEIKTVLGTNHLTFDDKGEITEVTGMIQDITKRKRQEQELREYSDTQAVLLREVNHRVKNNLAAIISMLHREEEYANERNIDSYLPVLTDLVGRVQGLSTVHSILSQSGWKPLLLSELCMSIIGGAMQSVPVDKKVDITISPSKVKVNSTQAHHLTLVINELTTNVVKHTLGEKNTVSISVNISQEDENIIIQFRDNGPGFPENLSNGDFSSMNIGFELITGIVTQSLDGTVEFDNDNGGVVTVKFENEKTKKHES